MPSLGRHVVRAVRAVTRDLVRPPRYAPGHFFSSVTSPADRERAIATRQAPTSAVDLREAEQMRLAQELDLSRPSTGRWTPDNSMFGAADASMLRGMLLHHRPERLVEIGSGYSTALALDVAEQDLPDLRITCVEPYADRLRSRLRPGDTDRLTLLEQPLQDVDMASLVAQLRPGDVFFIDSTHVVKAGSDVLWLLLRILPALPDGVIVHIHDVLWPFEYPDEWLREGRDWTEVYFVHAFLAYNSRFRIVLFGDWLATEHPDLVAPENQGVRGGSLWLEKVPG
ncbi:class I SAM-dependent methyltransferase [Blastococcus tunisiensis]|uniref:Methyltransferase domain-containing protein n=1 Tax=Blastococcus tunisiensis TaxID=1798228 RepID=A0A1I1XC19_9ACTN|nr:class I SAM-dependent methyltransferase [Blastococcus sp. DSM 46838]SFE04929.1 Methyltransferase domain-containing protein [Blastococcus sp. DSM 46838]